MNTPEYTGADEKRDGQQRQALHRGYQPLSQDHGTHVGVEQEIHRRSADDGEKHRHLDEQQYHHKGQRHRDLNAHASTSFSSDAGALWAINC